MVVLFLLLFNFYYLCVSILLGRMSLHHVYAVSLEARGGAGSPVFGIGTGVTAICDLPMGAGDSAHHLLQREQSSWCSFLQLSLSTLCLACQNEDRRASGPWMAFLHSPKGLLYILPYSD